MRMLVPGMVIAASALLTACGGGGGDVGSTPTPPPSPTQKNSSLLNPSQSENFTNDAATGTARYPTSGANGSASAASAQLAVSYDADAKSYTITTGGRSQTFRPADKDTSVSNAQITVYVRTNGSTTDSLTLTNPGTSGRLTYKHVGAGYWQRTRESSSTISGSVDAFTYGVETPDASLPRNGSASFAVDLLGVFAGLGAAEGLSGSGRLDVDFGSGRLLTYGTVSTIALGSTTGSFPSYPFSGSAQISSSANSFAGTFDLGVSGGATTGSLAGRFYGPQTKEVGATFATTSSDGRAAVGALIGRLRDENPAGAATLLDLQTDSEFAVDSAVLRFATSTSDGTVVSAQAENVTGEHFSYDPTNDAYRYDVDQGIYTPADKVAAESTDRFTVYRLAGTPEQTLKLFNPGPGNTKLALTYASFGTLTVTNDAVAGELARQQTHFTYGQNTDPDDLPRLGHAIYKAELFGTGTSSQSGTHVHSLRGDASFDLDFANSSLTGTMTPVAVDNRTNESRDLGTLNFQNGAIGTNARFTAGFAAAAGAASTGTLNGALYGPTGNEIGAVFAGTIPDPAFSGETFTMSGAIVGKKQ